MYETAIPEETRQRLAGMDAAEVVVGIPSYRNSRTVACVVETVAKALHENYAAQRPVIVHADGHSFDDTLATAAQVPLPATVRRLPTRYQGLPGKGSALRAIFESAIALEAKAILIIEADVTSLEPAWISQLLEPVLNRQLDMVLPRYSLVHPAHSSSDLLLYPLISAMYRLPLRQPTAGEIALAGGVAAYFIERDVWETDVARNGIDIWMTLEVALEEGRIGEVHVGPKWHRNQDSASLAEAKFLQEVGTLFRSAYLHEAAWRGESPVKPTLWTLGLPLLTPTRPDPLPLPLQAWRHGKRAIKERARQQWAEIMQPAQLQEVEAILAQPEDQLTFDEALWTQLVYDFMVVYNLGEGDPDKVVTSLYPLFLLRHSALLAEMAQSEHPEQAREGAIQRQQQHFITALPYLRARWEGYVSPEQLALWRKIGLLPDVPGGTKKEAG